MSKCPFSKSQLFPVGIPIQIYFYILRLGIPIQIDLYIFLGIPKNCTKSRNSHLLSKTTNYLKNCFKQHFDIFVIPPL